MPPFKINAAADLEATLRSIGNLNYYGRYHLDRYELACRAAPAGLADGLTVWFRSAG